MRKYINGEEKGINGERERRDVSEQASVERDKICQWRERSDVNGERKEI